ncbi:unnamed protein product [Echinostoma caproni]|uniref:CortBP2 domain-containing protein n=1 Tax=Echinostoma caproni TaxID=27848 RepID=A0A183B999_9TREM|nr:unnamed protein product [Echinostoma caproni]
MSFENDKSELEAREEVINTLRLVVPSNPAHAEADLKPLYDTQLVQLENLITSQRRAQDTMREQLLLMESKYLKVCKELEDERNKHERDAAQGDDVLVMLEKERERLKSERGLNRKLEKDLRKVLGAMKEQAILLNTQKMAAVSIIKERHRFCGDRKLSSDHTFTRHGKSNEVGSTPPSSIEPSDSLSGKEHSPVSHEYSPSSAFGEGSFVSRECIRLRRLLTEEINARKVLQDQFER